jgi:hypothetical protein
MSTIARVVGDAGSETRSASRERSRKLIVALVMLIYFLLIFEGVLRKWVFPGASHALYFVRDPFVVLVYVIAASSGWWPQRSRLANAGLIAGAIGLLLAFAQVVTAGTGLESRLLLAAYGWRNYFLYIPLAAIIGEVVERRDLKRLVRLTLLLAIPMSALVFLQFRATPDAPINIGTAAEESLQFRGLGLDIDHTRPMGTFTSDVGEKLFVVSCIAMLMAGWVSSRDRRMVPYWQLLAATAATLTCLGLGGSRSAMLQSAIVVTAAVASSLVLRRGEVRVRAILLPAILCTLAVTLYPLLLPEGYSTFTERWTSAAAVESQSFRFGIFGRALYGFIDFVDLLGSTPALGYGLGLAGNASLTLGVEIAGFTGWAESDWARHIVDLGPVFGVLVILSRIALVYWLGRYCLEGARRLGDPLPLLLFASIGFDLLSGQLTGHGSVNGYGWVFAGLCLASARKSPTISASTDGARSVPPVRFPHLLR